MEKKKHKVYKRTKNNWKKLKVYLKKIKTENEKLDCKSSNDNLRDN